MHIDLDCCRCQSRFASGFQKHADQVLERMSEDGPWDALGDGETVEDMVYHALTAGGDFRCPDCGEPAAVNEASLGRVAMELLTGW